MITLVRTFANKRISRLGVALFVAVRLPLLFVSAVAGDQRYFYDDANQLVRALDGTLAIEVLWRQGCYGHSARSSRQSDRRYPSRRPLEAEHFHGGMGIDEQG